MARQRDDVAGLEDRGDVRGEARRRRLVRQQEPVRAGRAGFVRHSAASESGRPCAGKIAVTRVPCPGVESSSTVQRLRQSAARLGFPAEEVAAIIDSFHFIQLLRLRSQHLETEHDAPGDNRINPDTLNELDRRILKEAFRQARKLQLRLKLDYQL